MFGKIRKGGIKVVERNSDEQRAAGVLAFLHGQGLSPTPLHYQLGWLIDSDPRSFAARAADAILISGNTITPAQAIHIINAYEATKGPTPITNEDPNCVELRHQTLHLAELTADAVAATGQLGRDLDREMLDLGSNGLPIATIVASMISKSRDAENKLAAACDKISNLREQLTTAKHDSQRDALTGLANRRGVYEELRTRPKNQIASLAVCDIDFFKAINDRYGHPLGDRVLKSVAASICESCSPHLVARWGGEEFVVIFDAVSVRDAAVVVNEALADLATRKFRVRETDEAVGAITFSAGVVPLDPDWNKSLDRADKLLLQAKALGRNRVLTSDLSEKFA